MNENKHTPTPWYYRDQGGPILDDRNCRVCDPHYDDSLDYGSQVANAEHIVRCVNVHDELVAACRLAYDYIKPDFDLDSSPGTRAHVALTAIVDALAKAKGGE